MIRLRVEMAMNHNQMLLSHTVNLILDDDAIKMETRPAFHPIQRIVGPMLRPLLRKHYFHELVR
jgi:hypothetical protein